MTPLQPRQLALLRINFAIFALTLLAPLIAADIFGAQRSWTPSGAVAGAGALLLVLAVLLLPLRRYRAWGYRMEEDELVVKHGLMVRKLTVVPFGRVQHIDIAQGPLQRAMGLATLVLNTAGTRGAAVRLPGLLPADAEAMRDHVRSKIRQDLV